MKKVLAIAPYSYLPYFSGGQKFIAQFFKYLGREVDLTVISVAENDFSLVSNYQTIPVLKKSFNRYIDPGLPSKIISLIKKEKFDLIIWEHPYYAWAAYRIKKQTGITTILHSHNIEYQRFKTLDKWWWRVLKLYEKWFFRFADYIFFITPNDKRFAIEHWAIPAEKCIDVPFGIEIDEYPKDREICQQAIKEKHKINEDETILLFNGVLDYKPNLDALKVILEKINPFLLSQQTFKYKILISGKRLPAGLNELKEYKNKNIIYAGFVDDIETYFKGVDLFLNPVQSGGGIKTKMVEAIGFGTTVIATKTGAMGINIDACGEKLIVIKDDDWNSFSKAISDHANDAAITPLNYYSYYFYGNIVHRTIETINTQNEL